MNDWRNSLKRDLVLKPFPARTYLSERTDYYSQYYLANTDILYIQSHGTPDEEDMKLAVKGLEELVVELGAKKIHFIWEIIDARQISIKVRKILIQANDRFNEFCLSQFIVADTLITTLLSIYKLIKPDLVSNFNLVSGTSDALDQILGLEPDTTSPKKPQGICREQLDGMSKQALIEMILNMDQQHQSRTREIKETIGQISWNGSFKPIDIHTEKDDPYHELYNAVTILQYDAYEIIGDLMDLNQNLEVKVAERIMEPDRHGIQPAIDTGQFWQHHLADQQQV